MDLSTELKTQKQVILNILRNDERARNDDKWLTYRFFSHYTKIYIPFEDFVKIPAFANAQKLRQIIQNKQATQQSSTKRQESSYSRRKERFDRGRTHYKAGKAVW